MADPLVKPEALDAWERHEKIAMHFNDLILRLRTQALGGLAALLTIGGVALKTLPEEKHIPWDLVAVLFAFLLAFWIAIWILDFRYYNRLLLGAVDALLKLEDDIRAGKPIELTMSHIIESAVHGKPLERLVKARYSGPQIFYSIVTAVLVIGILLATHRYLCTG